MDIHRLSIFPVFYQIDVHKGDVIVAKRAQTNTIIIIVFIYSMTFTVTINRCGSSEVNHDEENWLN